MESNRPSWMGWCIVPEIDLAKRLTVVQIISKSANIQMTQIILASGKGMMSYVLCLLFKVIFQVGKTVQGIACTCTQSHSMARAWFKLKFWPDLFFFTAARALLPVLIAAAWLLITRSLCCSSAVVSDEESQEIRTQHWLPEPAGVTLSPLSGARASLSGVPLLSCYLVPLSGHGKLFFSALLE